jgi:hypothetical protein
VVNADEAQRVRAMYDLYVKLGTLNAVWEEVSRRDWRSKQWTTEAGVTRGGNLSVAGNRLMGFCRTNLFKRLESSGHAFLLSVERHILRNFIYLHAVENGLELPIGTQDAGLLDTRTTDSDENGLFDGNGASTGPLRTEQDFRKRAAEVYAVYAGSHRSRFDWIRPAFFKKELGESLLRDSRSLLRIFDKCDAWDPKKDAKLKALIKLVSEKHKTDTQNTLKYVKTDLHLCGLDLERLSELPKHLDKLLDVKLEVTKKTKGDNENIYFNRRIETAGGANRYQREAGDALVPF